MIPYESPNPLDNEYQRINNPDIKTLEFVQVGDYVILHNDDCPFRIDGFILDKELIYNLDYKFVSFNKIKTLFKLKGAKFSKIEENRRLINDSSISW